MKLLLFILPVLGWCAILHADVTSLSANVQMHYEISRDFPVITAEFQASDRLGYTFSFIDFNFDHYRTRGGISDFYLEVFRYFRLTGWNNKDIYFTMQYADGSKPINGSLLGGVNASNNPLADQYLSAEFLLRKEYHLGITWQFTMVWVLKFYNGRIIINGFFDFWNNDTGDSDWPSDDPEVAATRYSFQAEPQIGYLLNPRVKVGSELEISRGFLGSVTGKVATQKLYYHDQWYFLPTIFIQYNF